MTPKETAYTIRVWTGDNGLWLSSFEDSTGEECSMMGCGVANKGTAIFHALNSARTKMAEDKWDAGFNANRI